MLDLFNSLNTIEDVEKFITATSAETDAQARENTNIEYKQANQNFSNTNEIGKDVSAFANSEGGIIFYGVSCDPVDRTKPKDISGLLPANIETLDRIINSHIQYPIKGIQKKLIPRDGPQVMLLYVPQSDESPHQNNNGKYYMRLGSETRHMPHYLVELHFGKRRKPKLSVTLEQQNRPHSDLFQDGWSPQLSFHPRIVNSGKAIAKYIRALFLFQSGNTHFKFDQPPIPIYEYHGSNISNGIDYPGKKVMEIIDNQGVIHPKTDRRFGPYFLKFHERLIKDLDTEEANPILEWEVYAEGMEPQKGKIILTSLFRRT